jgi:hypothetical protein
VDLQRGGGREDRRRWDKEKRGTQMQMRVASGWPARCALHIQFKIKKPFMEKWAPEPVILGHWSCGSLYRHLRQGHGPSLRYHSIPQLKCKM